MVDFLRSCYSTQARFYVNDPRTATVQWYFCDDDANDLGFGTTFTSNIWMDTPESDQVLGEVAGAPRTWVDGAPPFPVGGLKPCGTIQQFQEGLSAPEPIVENVFGGLACCDLPPSPFIHYACVNCPQGAYDQYTTLSPPLAPTNPLKGLPEASTQTYVSACFWDFVYYDLVNNPFGTPASLGKWIFIVRPDGVHVGVQDDQLNDHLLYGPAVWDCRSLVSVPRNAAGIGLGVATPIVLVPGEASAQGFFCVNQGAFLPTKLLLTVAGSGRGLLTAIVDQDIALMQTRQCVYRGVCWFTNNILRFRFQLGTTCELRFLPAGVIEFAGISPRGAAFFYSATAPVPWDGSPIALLLDDPAPILLGLPLSVMLRTQSDLVP